MSDFLNFHDTYIKMYGKKRVPKYPGTDPSYPWIILVHKRLFIDLVKTFDSFFIIFIEA